MNNIGIVGNDTNPAKKETKKEEAVVFKEWDINKVKDELKKQIALCQQSKKYKNMAELASTYLLTAKSFRQHCQNDEELSNLLMIYNGLIVEKMMTQAINSGKINPQTEAYLKDEMQAYTGTGFEQYITFEEVDRTADFPDLDIDVDKKPGTVNLVEQFKKDNAKD